MKKEVSRGENCVATFLIKLFGKKNLLMSVYLFLLVAFTIYIALDTFVIVRVDPVVPVAPDNFSTGSDSDETREPEHVEVSYPFTEEVVVTDNVYSDRNIAVTLTEERYLETTIYVADIYLSSVEYLKTAFANDTFGKNITETVAETSARHEGIIAVNGDFYGCREKGYVLRNGLLYRDSSQGKDDFVIYYNGDCEIVNESSISAKELLNSGAKEILSFGPALIVDSKIVTSSDTKVDYEWISNPRTAIAMVDRLHYIFLVADGRTETDRGLSLDELAEFLYDKYEPTVAYNLDGGGSSTMYFNGKLINKPTTYGNYEERKVSDIVYIGRK